MSRVRIAVALALCASACRVGPEHQVPDVPLAAQWTEAAAGAATEPVREWWSVFDDATLDALVERALANNLDVQIAATRIREARALRAAVAGAWQPQVNAGASFARTSSSEAVGVIPGPDPANLYSAGFDARWEIDLFGRRDHAVDAADAGVDVAIEGRRDAIVSMLAEVARTYVEVRGLQRQIAITRSNLELQRDTSELTQKRFTAGFATDFDVARAESQLATTTAAIPQFESRLHAAVHALSVLLGEAPGELARELEADAPIPAAPAVLDAGLPSQLLRRRPDVRAAERELARATAETGEAVAARYPSFSIGAVFTQQARTFEDLFDAQNNAWSLGGSLTAPILNGGTLKAQVEAREARADAARLQYKRTVLAALAEVETALAAVARERTRQESLTTALEADRRALLRVNDLYTRGIVSFFEVLAAQQSQLRSESSLAESTADLAAQTVALYKALGGGWESAAE
jgi:NodT family efflux transporter outer membrane factor (OMF) lipoprotein